MAIRLPGHLHSKGGAIPFSLYVKSYQILKCPSGARSDGNYQPGIGGYTTVNDYAYNPNISGLKTSVFTFTTSTLVLGPMGDNYNSGGLASQRGYPNPVAEQKHLEGDNYLFADGHVKWVKPERVLASGWDGGCCSYCQNSPDKTRVPTGSNITYCPGPY